MHIDKIDFGCLRSELEDYMTTVIYVNGTDLRSIIDQIEMKKSIQNGLKIQNDLYEGISFFIAFHNQNHFLCETLNDYIYDEKRYTLFDYKYSGVPGDHSLTCKIEIGVDEVIWYDFKNFSKIFETELNYNGLEFRFSTDQYFEAINTIRNSTEENIFV